MDNVDGKVRLINLVIFMVIEYLESGVFVYLKEFCIYYILGYKCCIYI